MPFAAGNKLLASELNALPQVIDWTGTSSNSPTTSSTTETFDTVLGNVSIVADGSTQFDIELVNSFFGATGSAVAGDHFAFRIRDGGAAIPITATPGTEVANSPFRVAAISLAGQEFIALRTRVTPTAGTHIYGVSMTRDSGTGVGLFAGPRQLVVRTAGPA
jgi:hypothetical protein